MSNASVATSKTTDYVEAKSVIAFPAAHPANPETDQIVTLYGGTDVDCSEAISEYISGSDWRIKANANTGYSNAGLINNVAGKVIANFWLDEVYSPEEGQARSDQLGLNTELFDELVRWGVCLKADQAVKKHLVPPCP
jgi:hypothetical protein